jgi:hypothetical protein
MSTEQYKIFMCKNRRKSKRNFLLGITIFLIFCCVSISEAFQMRVWEDVNGLQIKGKFVREIFGAIEVRRPNGNLKSIPLEDLSLEDLTYVRTLIPPDVVVSVRSKESAKVRNEDFIWANDKVTVVTAEVEVRKKSRSPYQGTLKAEVYLIGKEMVTGAYTLVGKGTSRVHFTEENKGRYTFSTSATYRVYEEYNDLEIRGAEYEGYLAVVVDPHGNKLDQATDLSWLLDEDIDTLRQFYVGIFFDESCKKRSVPRPRYYDGRVRF